MSRLEMIRAEWLRQQIQALQEAQRGRWTAERCDAISALKNELNTLIRYK